MLAAGALSRTGLPVPSLQGCAPSTGCQSKHGCRQLPPSERCAWLPVLEPVPLPGWVDVCPRPLGAPASSRGLQHRVDGLGSARCWCRAVLQARAKPAPAVTSHILLRPPTPPHPQVPCPDSLLVPLFPQQRPRCVELQSLRAAMHRRRSLHSMEGSKLLPATSSRQAAPRVNVALAPASLLTAATTSPLVASPVPT